MQEKLNEIIGFCNKRMTHIPKEELKMSSKIQRSHYIRGTRSDYELATKGMKPICNISGINDSTGLWLVHPINCKIIHLFRYEKRDPFEAIYTWTETSYDPNAKTGFSSSGRKIVRLGKKTYYLARIVASTFVNNDDPQVKTIVVHKNGDKRDCRASNLDWVSKNDLSAYKKNHRPLKLNLKPKNKANS